MSADAASMVLPAAEDWLPVLELAVEEVFEIMLGYRAKSAPSQSHTANPEFTAVVSLTGALCGTVTVCCDARTAAQVANRMLGDTASSHDQIADALGEICNMVAGNFKNKLAGTDERCMLSVPTVISGAKYSFHSMAGGALMETSLVFEDAPVDIRLQLQG